jgi:hypothetical protein
MAKQNINIGVNPNDGTGDVVREAFRKSKENFDELYARPTGDMNKSTYDSDNSGAVDLADKVTGVDAAGNVTYYGKDAAGNIGFHSFSEDKVAVYDAGVAGFEGVLYIDIANFKLYLWDDVNEVYVLAGGSGGTATSRTVKQITNTTQYTVIAADFTDFILEFTANANEEISIVINSGVAPLNGELQMISTGNNKLVPSLTGVTATYPEQTNPKTILKGWLGGIVVGTDKLSFNGSLESTATTGIEEAPQDGTPYSRQDAGWVAAATGGTTYSTFTNTEDGLVPAPNVGGSTTYSATITSPTEGFTATEGQVTTVNVDLPAGVVSSGAKKVLKSDGWKDDRLNLQTIDVLNSDSVSLSSGKLPIKLNHSGAGISDVNINFPRPQAADTTELIFINCVQGQVNIVGDTDNKIIVPKGMSNRVIEEGCAILTRSGWGIGNQSAWHLSGDLAYKSPDATLYRLSIADGGTVTVTAI